ncbi:MAG: tol-pal system protein YbgF [Lysobacter sp.]|nr:tol-pal system protein YbgF [Lysobacter sp.]
MRRTLALCTLAAALVAAAPALAQRSLADRVSALEQTAANNNGNVDLLNQVQQLRSEVQALRAQLEEAQQLNAQLKADLDARFGNLDARIARIETGGVSATSTPAGPSTTPRTTTVTTERVPTVRGDAGKVAQSADERTAYNAAFDVLKSGDYVGSAQKFQQFLRDYPAGTYAPNAIYWLGESYYVTQNYELALEQFQGLLTQYPTHDKAPGALLKVGLSQYGLKQMDAAEATLARVTQQYPGTDAARTADDRLRAIQLGRVR